MFLQNKIKNSTRVGLLKKAINKKGYVKIMEVHDGLSALIANSSKIIKNNIAYNFDGFWASSLTDSASKGLPDIELVNLDSRLNMIRQITEVVPKPIVVDGDTGGDLDHFGYFINRFENAGVSMVIIEDKIFPKRNSFSKSQQNLEDIDVFSEKIKRGISKKLDTDFMLVARLESLIAGETVMQACKRAKAYLEAGADGIMIHSKSKTPLEILEFSKLYYQFPKNLIENKVLVCAPTTYNLITSEELARQGFNIIIYSNHQLRAAYVAMQNVCKSILLHDRGFEAEKMCIPFNKLFETVGMLEVVKTDKAKGKQ